MLNQVTVPNLAAAKVATIHRFKQAGMPIRPQFWQSRDVSSRPEARMLELLNYQLHVSQPHLTLMAEELSPLVNLPWADDHFKERVCGEPINPGIQWQNWPWGQSADSFREEGKFNHNYMERYWPAYAGLFKQATDTAEQYASLRFETGGAFPLKGIRGDYGDLNSLVELLRADPGTRQAYLPIFFPEDTGIGDGGRKPCTLGYQFTLRNGCLHTYYPMRSCDFRKHWADDIYLTLRLTEWVLGKLQLLDPKTWAPVVVGSLTMHCTSLHVFINDWEEIKRSH